jgi:hypothetical protein
MEGSRNTVHDRVEFRGPYLAGFILHLYNEWRNSGASFLRPPFEGRQSVSQLGDH